MESPARRPRLVVIVAQGISDDSRLRKTAVAAARDGWDVTLIGRSDTQRVQRSTMGPIDVIRVPVGSDYLRAVNVRKAHRLRAAATQFRLPDQAALNRHRAAYRAWVRQKSAEAGWSGGPRRTSLKALLRARRAVHRLRVRAFKWEQRRRPKDPAPVRDWRRDRPQVVDLDLAFGPVIEKIRPDVIHAGDVTVIVTAARSAARLRAAGHRCAWVYDAHEYVKGVEWPDKRQAYALPAIEAEFIGRADAVVTVSTRMAELLKNDHQLSELPLVVGDSPVHEAVMDPSGEARSGKLVQLYRELSKKTPPGPRPEVSWTVRETPGAVREVAITTADGRPGWRKLGDTTVRLGLGPANHAGQAAAYAQAITRLDPDVSVEVVMNQRVGSTFDYPADVYVDVTRLGDLDVQLAQAGRIVGRYTHLLVDAFMPVFGHLNGTSVQGDLAALGQAGIKVGLLAHGSEIRHPGNHMRRHACSLFHDAPEGIVEILRAKAELNKRIADEAGLPLFVTTPDLLDDLPTAMWAPLVVDVRSWASEHPVMERERPVVLHAPSKRWTKGTDRIVPVLTELHDKGVIEFRLAEGIPWTEMRELVRSCDLVLDQFTTGSYGTFAVEAMAAGRPVIGYISDEVKAVTEGALPIVNATPDTLRTVIESLLDDRAATARVGHASVGFARTHHDGTRTAQVIKAFLGGENRH
ncbi:glycosyltransferase [Streptomyces sp. NPDC000410]|uniref:glycosyltransferase n=1 Tax=Streptomyces sp. NPDC000410 TaxID=3154254 RepID=UPI0033329107